VAIGTVKLQLATSGRCTVTAGVQAAMRISIGKRASVERNNQLRNGRNRSAKLAPLVEVSARADGRDENVVQT
jgi:hypothetical protein